jgi:hypothetical protein
MVGLVKGYGVEREHEDSWAAMDVYAGHRGILQTPSSICLDDAAAHLRWLSRNSELSVNSTILDTVVSEMMARRVSGSSSKAGGQGP